MSDKGSTVTGTNSPDQPNILGRMRVTRLTGEGQQFPLLTFGSSARYHLKDKHQ